MVSKDATYFFCCDYAPYLTASDEGVESCFLESSFLVDSKEFKGFKEFNVFLFPLKYINFLNLP